MAFVSDYGVVVWSGRCTHQENVSECDKIIQAAKTIILHAFIVYHMHETIGT